MKAKKSVWWVVWLLLLVGVAGGWLAVRDRAAPVAVEPPSAPPARVTADVPPARAAPSRARTMPAAADLDVIDGRVLDGVTHEGVPDAELLFLGDDGVSTFRTGSDGTFQLTPAATGTFALSTITAPGYLPYAPDRGPGSPRVTLARGKAVHGVKLLLYPATDYQGLVVDARGAPVAGARVRLVAHPAREPALDGEPAEWRTGPDGGFTFHAADDAVLEASRGGARGWAQLDRTGRVQSKLTIHLGYAPPHETTITGHVRDTGGARIAGALVRASPSMHYGDAAAAVAVTGPDGGFVIAGLDRGSYELSADAADHVQGVRGNILGGSRNVELTLDDGLPLAGRVVDDHGAPVAVFTLRVRHRFGVERPSFATRSVVDPQGRFALRVPRGDYDLLASVHDNPRGLPTPAAAGATDLRIVLGSGAVLRGRVIASDDHAPILDASVSYERSDRRGAQRPAPIAVTGLDGTFELTDLSAGPLAIRIAAGGYHARIETMTVSDGAALGPITIELTRAGPEAAELTELVGIGVGLRPDGDGLRVTNIVPGSGAFDAGVGYSDLIVAIDGQRVAPLGVDGTIARIRGPLGTTVTLTVRRGGRELQLVVERRRLLV